jgi:hypothetical protein
MTSLPLSLSPLRKTFLLLHEQSSSFRYDLLVVETGTCSILHSFETAVDHMQQSYEVFSSGKKLGDRLFLCYVAPTSTLAKEAHSPHSHSFQLKSPRAPSLEFGFLFPTAGSPNELGERHTFIKSSMTCVTRSGDIQYRKVGHEQQVTLRYERDIGSFHPCYCIHLGKGETRLHLLLLRVLSPKLEHAQLAGSSSR